VPLDPKARRPSLVPTFYPNSRDMEGASPVVLRAGEKREGVNIRMTKQPGFCIEGTARSLVGSGRLNFAIGPAQPSFGAGPNGGIVGLNPGGVVGPDGRFRICDLPAGVYRLEAMQLTNPGSSAKGAYGVQTIAISNRDLDGIQLTAFEGQPVSGEVV